MTLDRYRQKRDFRNTPEPRAKPAKTGASLCYVIQRHQASHLHYDFRLELDGVLKSWAIPKGPSLDPAQRRLAVQVEDHPLAYRDFEGVIPPPQYGAGTVMIWDRGHWIPDDDPHEAYRQGHLRFRLEGAKLGGGWSLIRMGRAGADKQNWLLIKQRDAQAASGAAAEITRLRPEGITGVAPDDTEARKSDEAASDPDPGPDPGRDSAAGTWMGNGAIVLAGIRLTHPSRLLFPAAGISKLELARYYQEIADWILPHLAERPLTVLRCPEGQGSECFFQRHPGRAIPISIDKVQVPADDGNPVCMMANSAAALVGLVQIGVLELHTWGARRGALDKPDRMIFDLDPAPDVPWPDVIEAARLLRALLDAVGLASFVKTTGGIGLHVAVPLQAEHPWARIQAFARAAAEHLEHIFPKRFTTKMPKSKRSGKIFIDYLRNAMEATTVAAYSTRARPAAPVSTPIAWDELDSRLHSDSFTLANIRARLFQLGQDPWAAYFTSNQRFDERMLDRLARS